MFTPVTVPEAPSDVVATANGSTVTITFEAPSSDGGLEITGDQVKADDDNWAAAVLDGNQIVLGGQTWGTHVYRVRAVNAAGTSPSATSNQVVLTAPGLQAYRSEDYYSGSRLWTMVFYTTVPDALRYEAQLDGGEWLPISLKADWITEQRGGVDGPGSAGNSFPVPYFSTG